MTDPDHFKIVKNIQDSIIEEIEKITGGNDKEFLRIRRAFGIVTVSHIDREANEKYFSTKNFNFFESSTEDKQPSPLEVLLSSALALADFSIQSLTDNNLTQAFDELLIANEMLGAARGYDQNKVLTKVRGLAIQQKATDKRHKENREMKEQVIKYYKDNIELFTNKGDAAIKISKEIAPVRESTVKTWLRNV